MIRSTRILHDGSLLLGYAALALLAQGFAYDFGTARIPIVWPAAGLALVATYHRGFRCLPMIAGGAFLARVATDNGPVLGHFFIAISAAAQAGIAALLIRKVVTLPQAQGVSNRTPLWVLLSTTVGAIGLPTAELILGMPALATSHLPFDELRFLWVQRWSAEAIGIVVGAPILHLWFYPAGLGTRTRLLTSSILFAVLATVTGVLQFWNHSESVAIRDSLGRRTLNVEQAIRRHINLSFASLHAIAQFFDAKSPVNREEFRRFVMPFFERNPGVLAFEWIPRIPVSGGDSFPITFIEPLERNRIVVGFDISRNLSAKRNYESAWETGQPSLSEPITLFQEEEPGELGVVGYYPVYQAGASPTTVEERRVKLRGFVGSVFRMRDLVTAAVRDLDLEGIEISLFDADSPATLPLFVLKKPNDYSTTYKQKITVLVENQAWEITAALTAPGLHPYRYPARYMIPIGSVATASILVVLIMVLGIRSSEIETLIKLRTRELERALNIRDDFVLAISHELKTPLTPLRLQIDFLQELVVSGRIEDFARTAEFTQLLASLGREVEGYSRLVEDLLDISRLSSGKLSLHRQRCDLEVIARDVVALFSMDGETEIHLSTSPAVGQWDAGRVRQILTNLLSNAIKYGDGKPVRITVQPQPDAKTRITVEDQGIGIASQDLGKIFERFERGVNIKNYAGLGVGLFIVRELVHAHGGSVVAESRISRGSKFTVDLPNDAST